MHPLVYIHILDFAPTCCHIPLLWNSLQWPRCQRCARRKSRYFFPSNCQRSWFGLQTSQGTAARWGLWGWTTVFVYAEVLDGGFLIQVGRLLYTCIEKKILCTPRLRMSTAFARSLHSFNVLYAIVQTGDCRHDICLIFCIPHQPTTQMCQEGRPHGFQGVEAILLEGWAYQPTMWIHKFLGNWDLAQNHQELVIFFRLRFSGLNKKNMAT